MGFPNYTKPWRRKELLNESTLELQDSMGHPDVQNIDLMNLADFCRNCLSKWYIKAAEEQNVAIDYDTAREIVYGMPYSEWKDKHQKEATPEQKAAFEQRQKNKS